MASIQEWFEKIAGITQEERERWAFVQQVYARREPLYSAELQMPACWRRRSTHGAGAARRLASRY